VAKTIHQSLSPAWAAALPKFSKRRAADAKALVDISRGFDGRAYPRPLTSST
jgi:hypothetical protein